MAASQALTSVSLLTICGLAEIAGHRDREVTHVLSLLDPGSPDPEGLSLFGAHTRTTLFFHDAIEPAPGLVLPTRDDVAAILAFGRAITSRDAAVHLLVHCHMGISRSTAAMVMLLSQAAPDEAETAVCARIAAGRPQAWPNSRMIAFADEALGRGGRLVEATARLYKRRLREAPDIALFMNSNGRRTEIAMAEAAADELP